MRTVEPQMSMSAVPPPGTTEAQELGCTCHVIAHEAATQEREPAEVLIDPDPKRNPGTNVTAIPDFAALHPGYELFPIIPVAQLVCACKDSIFKQPGRNVPTSSLLAQRSNNGAAKEWIASLRSQ
jgi:hypothetical protein